MLSISYGVALLELTSNAVHTLWKWKQSDQNPSRKVGFCGSCCFLSFYFSLFYLFVCYTFGYIIWNCILCSNDWQGTKSYYFILLSTTSIPPQMWQPASRIVINNDPEEAAAYINFSKSDSYVMSASSGKVSLFNMMMTFKVREPST